MAEDHADGGPEPEVTNEARLRALTSDHQRKSGGKSRPAPGEAQHRPGDLVDAVRERTTRDTGRDQPL